MTDTILEHISDALPEVGLKQLVESIMVAHCSSTVISHAEADPVCPPSLIRFSVPLIMSGSSQCPFFAAFSVPMSENVREHGFGSSSRYRPQTLVFCLEIFSQVSVHLHATHRRWKWTVTADGLTCQSRKSTGLIDTTKKQPRST